MCFCRSCIVLERMLAGVSTRRYRRTQEPVGAEIEHGARSTSKSAVSRTFVERTRAALRELMARRLDDVRLAVMMLDGIELKGRTNIVALGITTDGVKIPLGLWEGSTENATVATALLSDLVERGLDLSRGWAETDPARALEQLRLLARELERTHPGAVGSLREGIEETLTLTRLGITGSLKRTLQSTNPCESMIEIVRHTQRNVKRWTFNAASLTSAPGVSVTAGPCSEIVEVAARHAGPPRDLVAGQPQLLAPVGDPPGEVACPAGAHVHEVSSPPPGPR